MGKKSVLLNIIFLALVGSAAQGDDALLDLLDEKDLDVLMDDSTAKSNLELSDAEEIDDLEALKNDINETFEDRSHEFKTIEDELQKVMKKNPIVKKEESKKSEITKDGTKETIQKSSSIKPVIFDLGDEEKKLLELSKFFESKIPDKEWSEVSLGSAKEKYVVQEGDWLWKISQKLFGSGFYYSKIWSMNPHITNPHEVEPGMVLVFDTGSSIELPQVQFGEQAILSSKGEGGPDLSEDGSKTTEISLSAFGDSVEPPWIKERNKLINQGVYFQFASEETYKDLGEIAEQSLKKEHEKYEPPVPLIVIETPGDQYDESGFDTSALVDFNFKEGFYLNTFITTNIVQDLGEVIAKRDESLFIKPLERIYIRLDDSVKIKPGDQLSIYRAEGKTTHVISDRAGYKYHIIGQVRVIAPKDDLWECEVTETTGLVQRRDRITVYTPKIKKIIKTFNKRDIEAAIISSYRPTANGASFGDVLYLDRGRADGVEMGNVFELFSFQDKGTGRKISYNPTYKIGEITVITLTDNFATVLVTQSNVEIAIGSLALTKTEEKAAMVSKLRKKDAFNSIKNMDKHALDELDVELYLDDLSEDLLNRVDQIQLTEDELEELERQEREKSVIQEHEKDLEELERLEKEIEDAESKLSSVKLDEDKFLEQQNLDRIEKRSAKQDVNAFESLDDIEKEKGKKFMDQEMSSKENPYGLTEFDLEEIDEMLNSKESQK